jgi:hypothetical protein
MPSPELPGRAQPTVPLRLADLGGIESRAAVS